MWNSDMTAVYGFNENAIPLVLRRTFKSRNCLKGSIIVLDYTGRGASNIDNETLKIMSKNPVTWIDLANRYKPTPLFRINQSPYLKKVFSDLLKNIRSISGIGFSDDTIKWACEIAYSASGDGAVSLFTLLKIISSGASRKWFLDTQSSSPEELKKLINSLVWALSFPSVFSISSSMGNYFEIEEVIKNKQTLWLEMKMEYFEFKEWKLVCSIVNSVMYNILKKAETEGLLSNNLSILHILPNAVNKNDFYNWILPFSPFVKNIAVFSIKGNKPPSGNMMLWAKHSKYLWMTGSPGLLGESHSVWLSDKIREKVNSLNSQSVVVVSNTSGKLIVAGTKSEDDTKKLRLRFKTKREKYLKVASINQMSSAVYLEKQINHKSLDIYAQVCKKDILRLGWLKINEGKSKAKGVDNVSIEEFKKNLDKELEKLSDELKTHCYKPLPLKKFAIKKDDGSDRVLGIVSIRDKVVQAAFLYLVEPHFETHFSQFSFAFRPGRSAIQAVNMVKSKISSDKKWIISADIYKCFDSLDHDFLLAQIEYRIEEPEILDLVKMWITFETFDFNDFYPQETGVAQGSSVSPLMANIYLDLLDKYLERQNIDFVRYADDMVLFANSEEEAQSYLKIMETFLKINLHLKLKPAKTSYSSIEQGFNFLGFHFIGENIEIQQKKIDKTTGKLLNYLNIISNINNPFKERLKAHQRLDSLIRGFRNYFLISEENKIENQLIYLDGKLDQMAYRILPDTIRDDPLWITHERFFSKGIENEKGDVFNKTANIYNGRKESPVPAGWICRSDSKSTGNIKENSKKEVYSDDDKTKSIVNIDGRLSVFTNGGYLTLDGDFLLVKKKKKNIYKFPVEKIEILFIQGFAMNISVNLQIKLAELDTPVVFSPFTGHSFSVLNPVKTKNSFIRSLQILRKNDRDIILAGIDLISSKIQNQYSVLRYFLKYRKKKKKKCVSELESSSNNILDVSRTLKTLDWQHPEIRRIIMGHEGRAASMYWSALSNLVPDEYGFFNRTKKGAEDVLNQCLNYVYGIIYGEIWRALIKNGLDPYFGIIHGSKRDQGSLVFDMIEEFRAPFADRFVFAMIGRGFKPENDENGMLKNRSKYKLIKGFMKKWSKNVKWRSKNVTPAKIVVLQAASMRGLIEGKNKYNPYKMRW